MKKLVIFLLILIIGILYGCASRTLHFKYTPGIYISPTIEARTKISVNVSTLEGFPKNYINLNNDIKEEIITDLQENLFPMTNDGDPELFVNIDVKILKYNSYPTWYSLILYLTGFICGITLKNDENDKEENSTRAIIGLGSYLGAVLVPNEIITGFAKVNVILYTQNHKLIARYIGNRSIKKEYSPLYGGKYKINQKESVVSLTLAQAMDDIKSQIKKDRYKIIAAIKQEKEYIRSIEKKIVSEDITSTVIQPPKLIFNYLLVDENGDKILDGGEKISLKVIVKNQGEGVAQGVKILLSGNSKALDYLGREKYIGDIKSNTQKVGIFETVLPNRIDTDDGNIIIKVNETRGFDALKESVLKVAMLPAKIESEIDIISILIDVDSNIPKTIMSNKDAVAVVIGNRNYEKNYVPTVEFADRDAKIFKQYLVNTFGYREGNIIYVPDASQSDFNSIFGTKGNYKGKLYNYIKSGESDIFIYYSGHGAPDFNSKQGYFVPVDCDPSLVALNGYSLDTFYNNLSKLNYNSLTVVIDACFSGLSEKGMLISDISPVFIDVKNPVIAGKNTTVFTSATGEQVSSWYRNKKHSLFTYYFLKALNGEADKNGDKKLTLGEIRDYIDDNVPYMARRLNNREQTPQFIGDESKIIVEY